MAPPAWMQNIAPLQYNGQAVPGTGGGQGIMRVVQALQNRMPGATPSGPPQMPVNPGATTGGQNMMMPLVAGMPRQ